MTTPQTDALLSALADWEANQSDLTDLALRLSAVSAGFEGGDPFRDTLSFAYRALLASEREASRARIAVLEEALRAISRHAPTELVNGKSYRIGFSNAEFWAAEIARAALNSTGGS